MLPGLIASECRKLRSLVQLRRSSSLKKETIESTSRANGDEIIVREGKVTLKERSVGGCHRITAGISF